MDNKKVPAKKDFSGDDKLAKKPRRPMKRKVCEFCEKGIAEIDYKDVSKLRKYITEKGKIISARTSGCCAHHQRQLTVAIKRARMVALLPFKGE
ncbi:MAG: 30S ribosomal protein S18 [Clostridia bacterium]|nr:30S ribosomal protein S18 [Clostridia bacterium]